MSSTLQSTALGWAKVAGLGISMVVAGQFSGWNYGLAVGGWGGLMLAALLTGLFYVGLTQCVAELAAALPSAGGSEAYCRQAFGAGAGYIVGMSVLFALAIAIGVVASFAAAYGKSVLGIPGWVVKAMLFGGVLFMQLRGAREAVGATMVVGIIAITVLLLFCVAMAPHANIRNLVSPETGGLLPHGFVGVLASVPFALWLFLGVEQAALAAEETADPGKTIPKALTVAIGTLVFVGLSVLIFGPAGGGLQELAGADDPLYAALTSPLAYGRESWLTLTIGSGALVGLVATFFSVVYTSSRQLYSLARDGYLPRALKATNRRQAPHMALLAASAIGLGATLFAPEKAMLLVIFLLSVSYLFTLAAFVRLRASQPDLPRPFLALGGSVTAIATAALALVVVWACFVQQPAGMIYAVVVYAALIVHFMVFHRPRIERLKVTPQ